MRDEDIREEADLADLGVATEKTLGDYDPVEKENFVIPEARN